MKIPTIFAEADRLCDYIPFVSTVSNIVDLFQKCVYRCLPENIARNRYWTHIKWKEVSRCLILLIPILGNIYIVISDYFEYQREKACCKSSQDFNRELGLNLAGMLASLVSKESGQQVTAEQIKPAPIEGGDLLWIACFQNDKKAIQDLLNKGVPSEFYHFGQTPLVTACQHSTTEVVKLLVQKGADVNKPDLLGSNPFAAACGKGDLAMVQFLFDRVSDINAPNKRGITPFLFAASSGNQDVVQFLIDKKANRNATSSDGSDAVNCAIIPDHAHLLPLLLSDKENVDELKYWFQEKLSAPKIENLTPLLYAILVGAEKSAIYLIGRSNVQHLDSTGSNALYYAVKHPPLLEALLDKCDKAEFLNQKNNAGSTALHHAIELDQSDLALRLLEKGADPFIPNNEGKIPLLLACEKGLTNIVGCIQKRYADRIKEEELEEEITATTQAGAARRNQEPQAQPKKQNNPASETIESMFSPLESFLTRKERELQEEEEFGPWPRSGMEILLGKPP